MTLIVMDLPREVDVPADLSAALVADAQVGRLCAALSNSLQREHITTINAAKTADTRHRRIDNMLALTEWQEALTAPPAPSLSHAGGEA